MIASHFGSLIIYYFLWEARFWDFISFCLSHALDFLNDSYLDQGCQMHFHQGPHQPCGCLQRAEIILGLYKCNYSLAVKELKLHSAFEGNCQADVAPGENEFDTPAIDVYMYLYIIHTLHMYLLRNL